MSWKCIMLASRSATASESSAKAGSKALSGKDGGRWSSPSPLPPTLRCADSRKDDREDGRKGVVGRVRDRDRDRDRDRECARALDAMSWGLWGIGSAPCRVDSMSNVPTSGDRVCGVDIEPAIPLGRRQC